jgi:hypothetical protein
LTFELIMKDRTVKQVQWGWGMEEMKRREFG